MSDFMECDTCRAKSGTPYLCKGCLANRESIERLEKSSENWMNQFEEMFKLKVELEAENKVIIDAWRAMHSYVMSSGPYPQKAMENLEKQLNKKKEQDA